MQSGTSAGDSPAQSSNEQSRSHRAWADDSTTAFRRQFRAAHRTCHARGPTMSRNYELMREMEQKQALLSNCSLEPALTAGKSQRPGFPTTIGKRPDGRFSAAGFPPTRGEAAAHGGVRCHRPRQRKQPDRRFSSPGSDARVAPGAVCLVEANFRSPALPRMLGTTNYQGFTDALLEPGSIRSFMKSMGNGCLWLLSSGPIAADSPKLLAAELTRVRFRRAARGVRLRHCRCAAAVAVRGCDRAGPAC